MKNIHVLPTDKSSNIVISSFDNKLKLNNNTNDSVEYNGRNQHIYITSDEEIKEGDCCIDGDDIYSPFEEGDIPTVKFIKIILSTDQDLIKDGVQAIDDEFLEWFVKNPSCEEVEIEESTLLNTSRTYLGVDKYKIIIQKEEHKHLKVFSENGNELFFDEQGYLIKEEPKQETLEGDNFYFRSYAKDIIDSYINQQNEKILDFLHSEITERRDYSASKMCEKVIEFIEQFKNK